MRVMNSSPTDSIDEVVLFPFDECSMPFVRDLHTSLVAGRTNQAEMEHGVSVDMDERHPGGPVLSPGQPGSLDSTELICPNVFHIDGEYRMWYLGADDNHRRRCGLYAVSRDGFNWERPGLGLVEVDGSKDNNLVQGPCGEWVLYDPDDPDPGRRFKTITGCGSNTAFSPDGLHWTPSGPDRQLFGIDMECGHIFKWGGCYYVNGQGGPSEWNRSVPSPITQASKRIVITYASYDFVNWTHAAALSFRRDPVPPLPPETFEGHSGEQVHEGMAVWDRGNVLLSLYGQYRSATNDRRDVVLDLGFALSHNGLEFKEPIPDFKMVHSYELQGPGGVGYAAPRLVQRNAWANIDDRTVYWFSVWREESSTWAKNNPVAMTGVWVATWERDRLGFFRPCNPDLDWGAGAYEPHCISCPIELEQEGCRIYVNADRVGAHSQLRVELLNREFMPIAGYSGDDCVVLSDSGMRQPVCWRHGDTVQKFDHPVRVRVNWEGMRAEDARLFAVYVNQERTIQ